MPFTLLFNAWVACVALTLDAFHTGSPIDLADIGSHPLAKSLFESERLLESALEAFPHGRAAMDAHYALLDAIDGIPAA